MADLFRRYDVLDKRHTLSWNAKTREVVEQRMLLGIPDGMLSDARRATLERVVERVCPDFRGRPPTTTAAMVARKIGHDDGDGYRHHLLPPTRECWQRGLDGIEAEAQARFGSSFADLADEDADAILRKVQQGNVEAAEWESMPADLFWTWRLIPDCVSAHWAQPQAWSAIGFGGPASPRGYVRMGANRRDPWEAEEEGARKEGLPRHRAD